LIGVEKEIPAQNIVFKGLTARGIPDKQPGLFRKSMKTVNADERYPLKSFIQVGIPSKISLLKELSSKAYSGINRSAMG
jgi:hypothetical protein